MQSQETPWQRVYKKFGMSQAAFARALNKHRSKISRALKDSEGLINGRDQKLLIQLANNHNVPLTSGDLTPGSVCE